MIITEYISKNFQTINIKSSIEKAKSLMFEQQVNHLPVLNEGKLLGNLNASLVSKINPEDTIDKYIVELEDFYLHNTVLIFDSLKSFSDNETNVLPILNDKEEYLGVVLEETIIDEFSSLPFISDYGWFIGITTPIKKYSISEISNIVESNNGQILGLTVVKTDLETTQILLKIKAENISSIGDTFERFGYIITNRYFEDIKKELLKDRYNQLQKFMEV